MLGDHVMCNAEVFGSILAVCNYFCEDLTKFHQVQQSSDQTRTVLVLYSLQLKKFIVKLVRVQSARTVRGLN
jgi:undecaprenyl pyrophosphate phosphatase UppP